MIFLSEFTAETLLEDCFQELAVKCEEIARQVENEIRRDETRGLRIIPSYTAVHKAAEEEETIQDAYK